MKIGLLDYGAGNLHSLAKALEAGGASVTISHNWDVVLHQDALVLPGVGSFGAAVRSLEGRESEIQERLLDGYPCLGICLGMQLLLEDSEEGEGRGIGIVPGSVRRLQGRVVPQMGWNDVALNPDPLFEGVKGLVAYYANSYICEPRNPGLVIGTTEYEGERFAAAVRREKTWGVQFHPEKSSSAGLRVVWNFLEAIR